MAETMIRILPKADLAGLVLPIPEAAAAVVRLIAVLVALVDRGE